jgi:hypothetical protein
MKKPLLLLIVLSLSVSCSKSSEADKNLKKLDKISAKIEESTKESIEETRLKEAEDTRITRFEILTSKNEKFRAKLDAAAVFFKSFKLDNSLKKNDVRLLDAATEFTRKIQDIYDHVNVKRMSPLKDGKSQRAEQSFYAIAATMHMNNHYRAELIDSGASLKGRSFYDIIKSALRNDFYGEEMPQHEEVLVSNINKEIMTELVKARVDILSAFALKNLTDKRDMTLGQKLKSTLFRLTGSRLGSIDLPETFASANEPTKKQTIKYLVAANNAKSFLKEIGIEKELEKNLKSAFSKINLSNKEKNIEVISSVEEDARKIEIQNQIAELLK